MCVVNYDQKRSCPTFGMPLGDNSSTRRGDLRVMLILLLGVTAGLMTGGQAIAQTAPGPTAASQEPTNSATDSRDNTKKHAERTEAERIVSMRRLVEADRQQRAALERSQARLHAQFDQDSGDFEKLDTQLTIERGRLDQTADVAEKSTLRSAVAALEKKWTEARDHFDLVIQRRKAIQAEIGTLADKIAFEQQILDGLVSYEPTPLPQASALSGDSARSGESPRPPSGSPTSTPPVPNAGASAQTEPETAQDAMQLDDDVVAARKEQIAKQAALQTADDRVTRLNRGIDIFDHDLVSSRQLLQTAHHAYEAADKSLRTFDGELEQRRAAGAEAAELSALGERRVLLEHELEMARQEVNLQNDRVVKSETAVDRLRTSRIAALEKLRDARSQAKSAKNAVLFYESPIAPHRLRWWLTVRGPRVLAVLVAMAAFWWLARIVGRRVLAGAVRRGRRGTQLEREGRAETIRRAFQSGASAAIIVLGALAVLHQAGIDVTVLLGGTAVVGAAIAFGSQNMVHDYFGGFMILIENQYSVGNVIRIGDITGTVEGLSLRMTSLRDLEGVVHFIPHSQVAQVSNLTYGWSRIVLDIRVSSGEDVDRVMGVLMEVARGLVKDPQFGSQLVGDPEMLGVDSLAGTVMVIKLLVKAQPLQRWTVKRELLRRIKKTFDSQGIKGA